MSSPEQMVNVRNEVVTGPGRQQILIEDPAGLFQPAS
jgi:hypothetical protein